MSRKCTANVSACGHFIYVQLPGLPVALSLNAETASDLAELLEEKLVEMVQPLNESPRDQWGAYRLQPDGWWSLDHSQHRPCSRAAPPTRKTKMKYDWITIAIENGGVLTTSKNVHGIASTMHWKGQESICGDRCSTLPDAITSLNAALEDDAAEEVCPSNDNNPATGSK